MPPDEVPSRILVETESSPLLMGREERPSSARAPPTLHHILLGVRRSSLLLAIFLVFFFTYLCLGGIVFGSLEQPVEQQLRLEMRNRIDKFLYQFPDLPGPRHQTAESLLESNLPSFSLFFSLQSKNWTPSSWMSSGLRTGAWP